jgi:hypothetical protein
VRRARGNDDDAAGGPRATTFVRVASSSSRRRAIARDREGDFCRASASSRVASRESAHGASTIVTGAARVFPSPWRSVVVSRVVALASVRRKAATDAIDVDIDRSIDRCVDRWG